MHEFKDGKTYVLSNDELLLIDTKGNVVKNLHGKYDALGMAIVDGNVYAHDKNSDTYHVYDMDGNMVSSSSNIYAEDRVNCSYVFNKNGQTMNQSYW